MSHKIYDMSFNKIYEALLNKALKKNRTKFEVDEIIIWLTGYDIKEISNMSISEITYRDFFINAPKLNPNRVFIKGKICGVDIEKIEDDLMREIRYLDKLIDELAKGKKIEDIKR